MPSFIIALLLMTTNTAAKRIPECGYKQCPSPKPGSLNVHLVPHSHLDAGWAKTFDQYYYGTNANVSLANVQLIYHSVMTELLIDKERRFSFSETAYFWRWWKAQSSETRATFRSLVVDGRVSFAGGGWVETDEATVDYLQILDQYTWGFRKLNDTVGPCGRPRAGWQVDSYGHSREHASLLAQMGFDGLVIGRVDYSEKEAMMDEDRLEFVWRGSDVLGKMSDLMTHVLYNTYRAPDGFCFDCLCAAESVVLDPDSSAFNADQRAQDFIRQIETQARFYDHDNILVPMGGDFSYQNAASWFNNIDNLISYVNSHRGNVSDVHMFYSSPSCYLKAIYLSGRRDKRIHVENVKADHFPYGIETESYWTGFYTSRPGLKYLAKRSHVFLQVAKQLSVLSNVADSYELHLLRHAVGLVSHHDAITGTSSQLVANDFAKTLSEAIEVCSKKISEFLSNLTPTWADKRQPQNTIQFFTCHHMNISQCEMTEVDDTLLLLLYNPLTFKTYHHVRVPATALHYSIRDFNDDEVEYQVLPLPEYIVNLPGRNSTARHELFFEAENIPPLGFTAYYMTAFREQMEDESYAKRKKQKVDDGQEINPVISNEFLRVTIDKSTGLLESIQHSEGIKILVHQNFYYYSQGQGLQSGAYNFRPASERRQAVSESVQYHTIEGQLVKEIRQTFSEWVSQTIRLYRGEEFVELEWVVGPVPLGSDRGKEVVTTFKTNISNDGIFYTDCSSRHLMRRTCHNDTRNRHHKKSISACYYPVTSRICLQSVNTSASLCVLTDRAQGSTSYNEGEIELMVHRRLGTSDGFGLDEPLNEEEFGSGALVRGKHRIFLGNHKVEVGGQTFSEHVSLMSRKWSMEPWLFFTSGKKITRRRWRNVRNKRYSGLQLNGLPRHIHVLTLEPWKGGSVLLRLENLLEKSRVNQKNEISFSDITVNLRKMFLHHRVKSVRETTLGANQWLDEARQMDWSSRYMYVGDDGRMEEEDYKKDNTFEERQSGEFIRPKTIRRRRNKYRGNYQYSDTRYPRSLHVKENNKSTKPAGTNTNYNDTITYNIAKVIDNKYIPISNNTSGYKRKEDNGEEINKETKLNGNTKGNYYYNATKISDPVENKTKDQYSNADDDVTKSMYEMYYKTRSRERKYHEIKLSDKNKENVNDEIDVNTEKFKNETRNTNLRMYKHSSVEESADDYFSDEEDDSDEDNSDEIEERILEKRSLRYEQQTNQHSSEVPEHDFLFTLRPTQIRTFVVWFEEKKFNLPRNK